MELSKVHPSHKMTYNDYGSDNHDDRICETCGYSTCVLCRGECGLDDDELQGECIGFSWTSGVYDGDRLIGRKSGTGWPKGSASGR